MTTPNPLTPGEFCSNLGTITMEVGSAKTIICINTIPVISAPPLAKSTAFNTLTTALHHNRHSLSPADCINALITNIPVPSASAEAEANRYANLFRQQFLQVANITPKAFLTKSGKICTADPLQVIAGHIPHIRFALVESSFHPANLCHSLIGSHQFTSIFATALNDITDNARIEFCMHLPQGNINPYTTTEDTDSDSDNEPVAPLVNPTTTLATSLNQQAPKPPHLVTAWAIASDQERSAMSTNDLHNIIEASVQYNKQIGNQFPHTTNVPQSFTGTRGVFGAPLSSSILAALSHPGNNHTHATTYRGNFSFVECQNKFNALLAITDPCTIFSNPNGGTVTLDYKSVQNSINTIISGIHYILFRELLFSQYVGKARSDINSSEFTSDTIRQIKRLKLQFSHAGKTTTLAPDDLYIKYLSLTHTLPHDAREWHASLPSMFLDALTPELRTHLCEGINPYTQPIFDTLTTKFDQEAALLQLRELSVKAALTLSTRHKEMETTFKSMLQHQPPNTNTRTLSAFGRPQDSLAETTIRQHQNIQPHEDISFVIKQGQSYPSRTIKGRLIVSDWPADFLGCLGCGSSNHFWQQCPHNIVGDTAAKQKFFDNLWCHKPHTYRSRPLIASISPKAAPPRPAPILNSTHPIGRLHLPPPSLGLPTPPGGYTNNNGKRPATHLFAITANILQHSIPGTHIPKMPISIHNGLPCIDLTLGPRDDASAITLAVLWDSCAALNSGNLQFHCWIMSQYPHLVSDFHMFDDTNPFEPIKLLGAVTNSDSYDADTHGQLTGVIRYFTPYVDTHNQPITISFGLGENVAVNSIIGWPAILDMQMDLSINTMTVISHTLHRNFPITCRQSALGPPPGSIFDTDTFLRNRRTTSTTALLAHVNQPLITCDQTSGVFDDFSAGFARRNFLHDPNTTQTNTEGIRSFSGSQSTLHPRPVHPLLNATIPQSTSNPPTTK